jgi:hypothetical protein
MTRRAKIFVGTVLVGGVAYTLLAWGLPSYGYISSDGGFHETEVPWKGRQYDVVTRAFEAYQRDGHPDAVLMRMSERYWACPNLWLDNLTHKRWRLPLAPPEKRGLDGAQQIAPVNRRPASRFMSQLSSNIIGFGCHPFPAAVTELSRWA